MDQVTPAQVKASGRSWWQARYSDGRILNEWDTLTGPDLSPCGEQVTSRWEEVPKDKMIGLRLLCPDGMAYELAAPEGNKFFQLKLAVSMAAVLESPIGTPTENPNRFILAHLIGVVKDAEGNCLCRAWDYQKCRALTFRDNIYKFTYHNLGALSIGVQQLKV